MNENARISNLELLRNLDDSFIKFEERTKDILYDFDSEIKRNIDLLISRQNYWAERVRYWKSIIKNADEDTDTETAYRRLEESEENLKEINHYIKEIEDKKEFFTQHENQLYEFVENKIPKLSLFLRKKYQELLEYFSYKENSLESPVYSASVSNDKKFTNVSLSSTPIFLFALPNGFKWVKVEDIDQTYLPPSQTNFRGTYSYEEIKDGFSRLITELLPLLQVEPNLSIHDLRQIDMEKGVDYKMSLEKVYDMFFSRTEAIYLTKKAGGAKYSVTNGLHRIKVAIDIGLSHIPAIAVETGEIL